MFLTFSVTKPRQKTCTQLISRFYRQPIQGESKSLSNFELCFMEHIVQQFSSFILFLGILLVFSLDLLGAAKASNSADGTSCTIEELGVSKAVA